MLDVVSTVTIGIWFVCIIICIISVIVTEKRIAKARNYRKDEFERLHKALDENNEKIIEYIKENQKLRNENKLLNSQYNIGDTITFVRNNKIIEDIVIGLNYEIRVEKEKSETYVAYKTLAYGFIGEEELDYDFVLNSLMERLEDLERNAVKVNREIKEVKENKK